MNENIFKTARHEHTLGNTLIVGAGPAAINIAVNISKGWCDRLGLVNRPGAHTNQLKDEFNKHGQILLAKYQNPSSRHLNGKVNLDIFYESYHLIEDKWDTLFICTPSNSYQEVIQALEIKKLKRIKTIILISPGIGSTFMVKSMLKEEMDRMDVITFSAYYAATKHEKPGSNSLSVLTKALKKRIYIASSNEWSVCVNTVKQVIESLGVRCDIVSSSLEAESKSITTYVHPPLFMNSFAMEQILSLEKNQKFMYKIYPEGPITQHTIRSMVRLWKEISEVVKHYGGKPINLLQFLNDDNYPVHEITLSREDIEKFPELPEEKQEYLLYIRYSAILIDPYSKPDKDGKYFEFSAVPFQQAERECTGKWVMPRIPLEDYQKLKVIYSLAQSANILMPQALSLMEAFEKAVHQFKNKNKAEFSNVYPDQAGAVTLEERGKEQ